MSMPPNTMPVGHLMREVENNDYYLPAIQREFVWPQRKIEALFDSLLRGYPIGTMLRWKVEDEARYDFQFYRLIHDFDVRNRNNEKSGKIVKESVYGVLDGQQRMTALNIGLRGSYTEKIPRLWWNNPNAFREKKLYMNLLFEPQEDDEQRYQIKFLTEQRAAESSDNTFWFRVGDILEYEDRQGLRKYRRSTPYADNFVFDDNLDTLWQAIWGDNNIYFFTETRQDLEEVLRIFIRLNTGGEPLSYSDLLFSLLTASWGEHDAREEVFRLVDDINKSYGAHFYFSKDYVLKALLVCSGQDVRFKTNNIRKKAGLESIWPDVQDAIRRTVRLLVSFGFDGDTLRAQNALLPIVYHLYTQGHGDDFLTDERFAGEREVMRIWLLKILLGQAFRGRTDSVLTTIRRVMVEARESGRYDFPAETIIHRLQSTGRLIFIDETLEAFVDGIRYGNATCFLTLSVIAPQLKTDIVNFHVDHLHPRSRFAMQKLADAGVPEEDIQFCLDHCDGLPNLHLLEGSANVRKTDSPLEDWLSDPKNDHWRQRSMIPDVGLSISNFREFYEERRALLLRALKRELGYLATSDQQAADEDEDLVTGEVTEEGEDLVVGEVAQA